MKMLLTSKGPQSLAIGEITKIFIDKEQQHIFIGRTKKGYYAEIPGFRGITVTNLSDLKKEEIKRIVTRGKEDYR
jgi:hypothetical protein